MKIRNSLKFALLLAGMFTHLTFDSRAQKVKIVSNDSLIAAHSPTKATILSAVLPGAGQAYNHKYWKIPVIYAGFAGLGYLVKVNNDDYVIYRNAYRDRLDGDSSTTDPFENIYSDQDLVTLKNYYRRNRDLSLIGIGVLYILNIIDAAVDAHLYHFNVSDDLTLDVIPGTLVPGASAPGIQFCFRF